MALITFSFIRSSSIASLSTFTSISLPSTLHHNHSIPTLKRLRVLNTSEVLILWYTHCS